MVSMAYCVCHVVRPVHMGIVFNLKGVGHVFCSVKRYT